MSRPTPVKTEVIKVMRNLFNNLNPATHAITHHYDFLLVPANAQRGLLLWTKQLRMVLQLSNPTFAPHTSFYPSFIKCHHRTYSWIHCSSCRGRQTACWGAEQGKIRRRNCCLSVSIDKSPLCLLLLWITCSSILNLTSSTNMQILTILLLVGETWWS